jgi:scyllo-inositol 2-dehydrogenase (NADP+)
MTNNLPPVRVAISSYGMSGIVFHGPLLKAHPGFRISKILERNRNDSEGRHPEAELVRNFEAILEDPEIELVVVNTPDHHHFEMATLALEAGKHVVVEKPVTLHSGDADRLTELAASRKRVLSVFQNRRWDGDFLTVREVIRTGRLGRLVSFESHFDRYRKEIKDSWKDQSNGTGTLYNLGAHLVDQALVLFGLPGRLFCDVRMLRDGAKTDDSFDLFLHYDDCKCLLRSSYLVREPGPRFILHGTEGSFTVWGTDPQEEALKNGKLPGSPGWGTDAETSWGTIHTTEGGQEVKGSVTLIAGNYMAYYDNVFHAIRGNESLEVTPGQAKSVIRVIEAAYRSGRDGRVIEFE